MAEGTRTPEQHHTDLMTEIDYEIDTYGPESLADMVAAMLESRIEDEEEPAYNEAASKYWRACRAVFVHAATEMPRKPTALRTTAQTK